jgi:excisionase family DNA binding protein
MSKSRQKVVATPAPEPSEAREAGATPGEDNRIEILINGVRVEVSPELEAAVQRAHKGLFRPLPKEMTTTEAAAFLDVSRPFVIKLIDQGALPFRKVGKHRRIPSDAVLAYREKMYQQAKTAADEMAQLSQELGLYEPKGPPPKAE